MKIKPLFDRVVLKPSSLNEKKSIITTDLDETRSEIGEVIELGTGGKIDGENIEFKVNIGDKVIFNKFATNEFSFNNNTYILLKQTDILAILKGENKNE